MTRLRLTRRISWAPSGWIGSWKTPEDNTKLLTVSCSDDFHAVRVGFANRSAASWHMAGCMAAATTTLNDACNPTGNTGWHPFTFASGGADTDTISDRAGAPTTVDVRAAQSEQGSDEMIHPRWTWSDWIACPSVARTDCPGAPRLLMIRTLVRRDTVWSGPNGGFQGYSLIPEVNQGFEHVCGAYPVDAVSTPRTINADATGMGKQSQPVACVQFLTRNAGLVAMTTGDSTHQGTTTRSQFLNYMLRSTIGLGSRSVGRTPFGYVSCAQSGFTSRDMFAALDAAMTYIQPSVVVLPGSGIEAQTEDDDDDAGTANLFLARLFMAAERCTALGALPIFLTPFPRSPSAMSAAQHRSWEDLRYAILGMREAGALVIDAADILGNRMQGELSGRYHAHMTTDHVNPNDAGHQAVATAIGRLVEGALAAG